MTQGPETPDPNEQPEGQSAPPPPPYGQPTPPPFGDEQAAPPPYAQQPYAQPPQQPQQPQPGFAYPNPAAPYGVHPITGVPYSDKSKLAAGLLQIFLGGLGIGRFYIGDNKTAIWQIVVTVITCGIGSIWGLIDGIIMLASDNATDAQGRPLRPS
jgi:TM2 domain-containing membrane protein YozV